MSKRFGEQKRKLILQKLEDSDLTAAEFCRRRGLCYGTVMGWRRKLQTSGEHGTHGKPFVEIEVVGETGVDRSEPLPSPLARASRMCAELSLPGGVVLRDDENKGSEAEV